MAQRSTREQLVSEVLDIQLFFWLKNDILSFTGSERRTLRGWLSLSQAGRGVLGVCVCVMAVVAVVVDEDLRFSMQTVLLGVFDPFPPQLFTASNFRAACPMLGVFFVIEF